MSRGKFIKFKRLVRFVLFGAAQLVFKLFGVFWFNGRNGIAAVKTLCQIDVCATL